MARVRPQTFSIEVVGAKELSYKFRALGPRVSRKVIRRSLRRGAVVFQKAGKRNVPKRTRGLEKSIKVHEHNRASKPNYFAQRITTAPHGHLVEYGTAPHDIPMPKGGTITLDSGQEIELSPGAIIKHPGATPKPFMRPAFDSHKGLAKETVMRSMLAGIEEEWAKP